MKIEALDLHEARAAMSATQQEPQTIAKVEAALESSVYQVAGLDPEDPRFKRLTSSNSSRDLSPVEHERMQLVCLYIATRLPFAKRIPEMITEFVVGENIAASADEEVVQEVIDRFWNDSINNIEQSAKEWSEELSKLGELCIPVAVNPVDGFVRIGYVDPLQIDCIEHGLLKTGDGREEITIPIAVRLRKQLGETEGRRLRIIRLDEDPYSPTFGQLAGDCFYFAINKSKTASRGISDLYCIADWADVLDQIVFDAADRIRFMNAWLWHFVFKGADEKKVQEMKGQILKNPPRQGGTQFTNDQVEIKALSPDFKSAEFSDTITSLKFYGLGGMGFPGHWFADPTDANRATAGEMGEPTIKKLTARQKVVKSVITSVLNFALYQAKLHGVIAESMSIEWTLQVPDLSPKDLQKGSTVLGSIVNPLSMAADRGWIREETAARAFHVVLTQVGIEVDSKEEFEKAQEESQARRAQEVNDLNSQANLDAALRRIEQGGGVVQ
ncbi:MAG TPA: hypothetical protein VN577_20035 [Terriglobales bacterium]|nr:hypothetical protein [Terriglobales bacterium]